MVRITLFLTTCVAVLTSGTLVADAAFRCWGQGTDDCYAEDRCSRVPFPTKKQLRSALTYLQQSPDSTLIDTRMSKKLKQKLGNHIYLRDASSAMWHIEGRDFDAGKHGCVYRAWNLQESVAKGSSEEASQVPPAVAKIVVDVNKSERNAVVPFTNEVDALRHLGRLVGSGYTILQSSQNHNFGFVHKEDGCFDPSLRECGRRCPTGTQAIFLQKMIPGVPMKQKQFWGNDRELDRKLIVRRIFKKVQELHQSGWVHNDIHPGNVLVNEVGSHDYDVELIDFGHATPRGTHPREIKDELEDVEIIGIMTGYDGP